MKFLVVLAFAFTLCAPETFAQSKEKEEEAVATAVRKLTRGMIDGNQILLEEVTSEKLSYGHSSGLIEDRDTYINALVDGRFGFKSIDLSDQKIFFSDNNTAIVRHILFAHTDDRDKEPGTVKLTILQVWEKEKGKWVLIARQAARLQN